MVGGGRYFFEGLVVYKAGGILGDLELPLLNLLAELPGRVLAWYTDTVTWTTLGWPRVLTWWRRRSKGPVSPMLQSRCAQQALDESRVGLGRNLMQAQDGGWRRQSGDVSLALSALSLQGRCSQGRSKAAFVSMLGVTGTRGAGRVQP